MAQATTIARPYAKAIFELVEQDAQGQEQWKTFLSFGAELSLNQDAMQRINQPGFMTEMESWFNDWLKIQRGAAMTAQEINLLRLLEAHGRLPVLAQIMDEFVALCSKSHNAVIVQVTSASPLDSTVQKQLAETLAKKIGKEILLETKEDASLMAGVVIEYDGQVIDQSMKGRLTQFARTLDE